MLRIASFRNVLLAAALLAGCENTLQPRAVGVQDMQISAELSANVVSLKSGVDSVILWITVRNPLPRRVVLGSEGDYPWWTVVIEPVVDPNTGVAWLVNPFGPLELAANADTVHALVLHFFERPFQLAPAEFDIRGGLDYTLSAVMRLRIED